MGITNNPLVCFFDSGIGGLNLLCESVRILPQVDFTYFADNYRVPYGALGKEQLKEISRKVFLEIEKLKPAAAVIACNTLTAQCIDYLRGEFSFEIIGIQPAIKPAAEVGGRILVLATPATAKSQSLMRLSEQYGEGRTTVAACPDLASYIENNIANLEKSKLIELLPNVKADAVVLGCTHYIFASEIIKNIYNCPVFDGLSGTAAHLREKLGIYDHRQTRAQKITFIGGNTDKNRDIFRTIIKQTVL